MNLDKKLTNRIFRTAIQTESAVIILINQQASAFGTDVLGQFLASPPKSSPAQSRRCAAHIFTIAPAKKRRARPSSRSLAAISSSAAT